MVLLQSAARASVTTTLTRSSFQLFVTLISNTASDPDTTVWVSSVSSVWVVSPSESASLAEYFSIRILGSSNPGSRTLVSSSSVTSVPVSVPLPSTFATLV